VVFLFQLRGKMQTSNKVLFFFICGLLSCNTEEVETGTTTTTTTTTTGNTTTATGTTTTETDKWDGWHVVDSDRQGFDLYGYVLQTWQIGPEAENYFQDNLGNDRRFYLLRPEETPLEEINLLLNLHGGAVDDDSPEDYYTELDPYLTNCGLANEVSLGFTAFRHMQSHEVMARGWAMVVPVNLWCDFWIGRGEEDPVDPEHHKGYTHVSETLDFLTSGATGLDVANLFAWGSSSGGAAALPIAHWYGEFDGVISDSPPCKMDEYFFDDQSSLMHIFGGPPFFDGKKTEVYQNYLDVSCDWLVESGGYDVPTYVAYNVRDLLTRSYSPESFAAAADAVWAPAGIRYGYHDWDHDYPGTTFHTQTRGSETLSRYTTSAMFSFLEGATVNWIEAEHGCTTWPCDVGTATDTKTGLADYTLTVSSGSGAIVVTQAEGAGVAYTGAIPSYLEEGETLTAVVVFDAVGLGSISDSSLLLTIAYENDDGVKASIDLLSDDFVTDDFEIGVTMEGTKAALQRQMAQYAASSLSFTVEDLATSRITVSYWGVGGKNARLYIDAIQYIQ
jgi:hypothetical protein